MTTARHRLAGVLLLFGALSIALTLTVDTVRTRASRDDAAQLRAIAHIPLGLAISHLWVEEAISGDAANEQEVWSGIRDVLAISAAMAGGPEVIDGPWRVRRLDQPGLRHSAAELTRGLQGFLELTRQREQAYSRGEAVGPGTPTDATYDAEFRALVFRAESLRAAVEARLWQRQARLTGYLYAVLAGWAAIVGIAFASLRRFENRRQQTAIALRERDQQLVLAQKMDAVGRLAGGVAHDINNYLAAIRAQCELMLRKEATADSRRQKLTAAISAVDKASTLIQRLLAFARRQPANPQMVDLNRIIVDLSPILEQHLGETVILERRLAPNLGRVLIDPSQLEQILVNLIVNARDAMPDGGRLTLATTEETRGEAASGAAAEVVMTVEDTGTGILPEVFDQMFEPFFTTKGGANSGLGLATVYGIAAQNGGSVRASNAFGGRGAVFEVRLPRAAGAEPDEAARLQAAEVKEAGELSARGHVLLVEDNVDVRLSTRELLAAAGYSVTAAGDGPAGLAAAAANPGFDLVVTDVVMPGISGPEMVTILRETRPLLPALFMTGYSDFAAGAQLRSLGTALLLQKPFSAEQLFAKIQKALAEPTG
ncbi:MAG: response regulator [Acidobacteriota bacterium]